MTRHYNYAAPALLATFAFAGLSADFSDCPAGTHYESSTTRCITCTAGFDFTITRNRDKECTPCTQTCKNGKIKTSPCNVTHDTLCQCLPGYHENGNECTPPGLNETGSQKYDELNATLHDLTARIKPLEESSEKQAEALSALRDDLSQLEGMTNRTNWILNASQDNLNRLEGMIDRIDGILKVWQDNFNRLERDIGNVQHPISSSALALSLLSVTTLVVFVVWLVLQRRMVGRTNEVSRRNFISSRGRLISPVDRAHYQRQQNTSLLRQQNITSLSRQQNITSRPQPNGSGTSLQGSNEAYEYCAPTNQPYEICSEGASMELAKSHVLEEEPLEEADCPSFLAPTLPPGIYSNVPAPRPEGNAASGGSLDDDSEPDHHPGESNEGSLLTASPGSLDDDGEPDHHPDESNEQSLLTASPGNLDDDGEPDHHPDESNEQSLLTAGPALGRSSPLLPPPIRTDEDHGSSNCRRPFIPRRNSKRSSSYIVSRIPEPAYGGGFYFRPFNPVRSAGEDTGSICELQTSTAGGAASGTTVEDEEIVMNVPL